ncbi:MAG: hypothetical protein ACRESO_04615 [Gammaproteobacteria bacterium]
MNINLFAVKKTQGVMFRTNKSVRQMDLGIQKLIGATKDELIMKTTATCCRNAVAPV